MCDDSFCFRNKREEGEISHYVTATVNVKVLRWYNGPTLCTLNPVTNFWKKTWTCSRSWHWRKTSAGMFAHGGHLITLRYMLLCWDWHSWFLFGTSLSWNFGRELVFPDSILSLNCLSRISRCSPSNQITTPILHFLPISKFVIILRPETEKVESYKEHRRLRVVSKGTV